MEKPVRILHIIGGMYYGGKESLLMSVYKKIDRNKIQFDFIVHCKEKNIDFHKEIKKLGGRVFYIDNISNSGVLSYIKNVTKIINENGPFIAVHSHMNHQSGINALSARIARIKIRICHVHATDAGSRKNKILLPIYKILIEKFSTHKIACSVDAGNYLFSNKSNYRLIYNGIDIEKFVYNEKGNSKLKDSLGINKDTKIIGHIGRFIPVKNHVFLLEVFKKILKFGDYVLILVGDGPELNRIKELSTKLNIQDKIYFLGVRNDIEKVISIFDVFLFPSLNEGFGMVLLEAQAAGIPCVVSNNLPKETDLGLNLVKYCSLSSIDDWVSTTININNVKPEPTRIMERLKEKGFDSEKTLKDFLLLYNSI